MVSHNQQFDICIICALFEEAKAALDEFSKHCDVSFTQAFHGLKQLEYHYATIRNQRGEALSILVTCLSETEPTAMVQEITMLVQQFRPRFVAMTGFCAGDMHRVQLGDLIFVRVSYHYNEGEDTPEADGKSHHFPEIRMFGPNAFLLQFAGFFDDWRKPAVKMKQQFFKRRLKISEHPRLYIAPMASGIVMHVDNPFPWLQERYYRPTVALDTAAASFYQALHAFPETVALVVKGVRNHADVSQDGTYHDYAARVSTVYVLNFIQAFLTSDRAPRKSISNNPIKIFFCYARKDKVLREELENHLEPLRRSGQITTWYDREIQPGEEWEKEIDKHLNSSNIVLLLISPHFMRSDYCYGKEMRRALERHDMGETCVVPIILRPTDWKETEIGKLQALPKDGKPITLWRNRDYALENVIQGVHEIVDELLSSRKS